MRAFVRLVEVGRFSAVAEELRIKQSTVSKWMASLEEELGVQLIERTTRALHVTDAGQTLYRRAMTVLDAYDDAVAAVQENDPEPRGRIRLSLPVVFGQRFVVPQVAKFLRRHKEVELEMVFSDRYVSLVEEGLDMAVRVGIQMDSTLRVHKLGESRRRLVASPGYLQAHGTPNTPQELQQHQCLSHSALSSGTIWSFSAKGKTHRHSVRGRVAANLSEATLSLARSGLGICLLASWLVDGDIRAGRLVPLLSDYEPPKALICALTPPGRHVPARVRSLIAHLRRGLAGALGASDSGNYG